MNAPPLLEMKGIRKRFAGITALDGVDLVLHPSEVVGLVGENGAGKSTLMRILAGELRPDGGEIRFEGRGCTVRNVGEARALGIALVHQEPQVLDNLDTAENVFLGREPARGPLHLVDRPLMEARTRACLEQVGAEIDPRTPVRRLSLARRQMVELARALSMEARILVLDEPTASLPPKDVERLLGLLRALADRGLGVIFISHRLEEAFELADRVTVLRDGHYIGTRTVKDATTDEVIRMMVGRTLDTLFPKEEVTPGEVMLRVDGLTKEGMFHNVSFELRRGEILGLAGLVGARRTNVAHAIFGISPADSGTIWVDARQVRIGSPRDALALGIVYVPEDRQRQGLVLPMDITQNITLPILKEFARQGGWLDNDAERQTAQRFVERLDVRAAGLWQKVQELSGGNQQKVVLAKWLAARPRILILDEPTRGIDVGTKAAVHELMSKLAGQGMTILMISSELPEILGMSDRIVVMYEGRVTAYFTRDEATQEKIMAAATTPASTASPAQSAPSPA